MVLYLERKATKEDIRNASQEFGDYIKIVVDIERGVIAIGGKLHADAEKILIRTGSPQRNLWGGGLDLNSKKIDTQAIINLRPRQGNDSMEILDPEIRKKFIEIAEHFLI